ncbi:hypothetical protein Lal_00007507 [Lupinus albus]|nr:hypothetical protein Lal_00007507 [Lupinus albus]
MLEAYNYQKNINVVIAFPSLVKPYTNEDISISFCELQVTIFTLIPIQIQVIINTKTSLPAPHPVPAALLCYSLHPHLPLPIIALQIY